MLKILKTLKNGQKHHFWQISQNCQNPQKPKKALFLQKQTLFGVFETFKKVVIFHTFYKICSIPSSFFVFCILYKERMSGAKSGFWDILSFKFIPENLRGTFPKTK